MTIAETLREIDVVNIRIMSEKALILLYRQNIYTIPGFKQRSEKTRRNDGIADFTFIANQQNGFDILSILFVA